MGGGDGGRHAALQRGARAACLCLWLSLPQMALSIMLVLPDGACRDLSQSPTHLQPFMSSSCLDRVTAPGGAEVG